MNHMLGCAACLLLGGDGSPTCGQWAAKRPWMLQYGGAILAIPENSPLLDAVKYIIKSFTWVGLTQLSVIGEVCGWVCTNGINSQYN